MGSGKPRRETLFASALLLCLGLLPYRPFRGFGAQAAGDFVIEADADESGVGFHLLFHGRSPFGEGSALENGLLAQQFETRTDFAGKHFETGNRAIIVQLELDDDFPFLSGLGLGFEQVLPFLIDRSNERLIVFGERKWLRAVDAWGKVGGAAPPKFPSRGHRHNHHVGGGVADNNRKLSTGGPRGWRDWRGVAAPEQKKHQGQTRVPQEELFT